MDPSAPNNSSRNATSSSASSSYSSPLRPTMGESNKGNSCMDEATPQMQGCPTFRPLPSSLVRDIAEWRPEGLKQVKAPLVETGDVEDDRSSGVLSWAHSARVRLSDSSQTVAAGVASTSGRPFEQTSFASASLTPVPDEPSASESQYSASWADIDSWRPSGLSPLKALRPAVPPPAVEILCRQPVSAPRELPLDLVEAIASFRPFGLAPIRVQARDDDSEADSSSSAGGTPQAPHANDRAPTTAFEVERQAADWRPAGLKPIRIRRAAIDESQNTPTAPKAAGASLRCVFGSPEMDSPRAPPTPNEADNSLSPTVIPDLTAWRPGLSPLRMSSPPQPGSGEPSPRSQASPLPSPHSGSPRPRSRDTVRLERDLGPLPALLAEGKPSGAASGRSSPGTPRFKSQAQRKGLTIQSRLRRDDADSNADSENTPPGSITPSVTPGASTPKASTPKSPGPSPLVPSNRQRAAQAGRWGEKEAKKSGAESTAKDELASAVQLLVALPSLAMLDRSSLQDVAGAAKLQRYGPSETVVHQGAPVDTLLLVVRGTLAAWQDGTATPLFHLSEGAACPHRISAASLPGWAASMVAGEQGASCLLVPLHAIHKRATPPSAGPPDQGLASESVY
ncbi:hypothetical protein KFL_003420100 [Klebsormidium nitens]|uniref:Cyclic nucleotide-binding domain-containing protein n=1 Tax=Klebsormidium nitens TaxID=105231 RepID=A0A1Y1IDU1_KLENI|nr:hypothetical protein KFL_003420100 [Klebsormidium nitens]|eukprot:GAQ87271.1 hypothetical protein KFL_003420100 [Klebsormidium nitens]